MSKKKQPKVSLVEISVDIFKHKFEIYIGDRDISIKEIVRRHKIEVNEDNFPHDCQGECLSINGTDTANTCLIWVQQPSIELVSHELDHAVFECLSACSIKFDKDNQEIHAYYLGWLVGKVFANLLKAGVKICA